MYIRTYIHTHVCIYLPVAHAPMQHNWTYIYIYTHINIYIYVYIYVCIHIYRYGVASVSRIDKIIGLFCKRALEKRRYSAKETYNLIDPTDRSHPIAHNPMQRDRANTFKHTYIYTYIYMYIYIRIYVQIYMHIYVYIYIYIYIYVYVYLYIYI